ncbi:serine/threonine-protein kinase 11-interacting protein isoform X3 [Callorhinchus milii]|nr:serine/threonine-protein kinase 11-interacting protein isoform X3 [Callorhinchus milii]XP_042192332.1 serine/threonine-protein kinase 11-interacting protein isoform X3 [Callorhinchus milii]XP_042192333.1 serine/threonine-protein kinase 11-interacting protein isoform X3 [Callorhinchus milii]|eukprot:gi/632983140/ref/XP_007908499.1/ PREDICTED: serine/threonine-protein kinase 11-interacting protein [Callorhinchus milii]
MASRGGEEAFVRSLARLLRDQGDGVLGGVSTLSLLTLGLQLLQQLFERHLLARQDQRGFVALASHPADTAAVLQLQFLFDILQKTVSLKLVHPPGPTLQTPVHIFAFKSLKYLQLKRIPPHCLEGLRGVYTQLEILVCTNCINTIEEIISVCGGDLSSALPWLDLHTLNFSHNHIAGLDSSLALLSVLRTLDLSHNHLQDCEEHLKPLSELEYVNLSYNLLQKVPGFSSSARVQLVTLLLRNNQLDNINGVEHLGHLQHLDLAYNLISEHAQLAPLSQLHRLKELYLAGNPVFYQRDHRPSTVHHLSPKAAFMRLVLDTEPLTLVELTYLPRSGQLIGQTLHHSSCGSSLKNVLEAPPSDGRWSPDISSGKLSRKKSKIKVRSASISDPSDSEVELRHQPISSSLVLPHQEEIERLDALRGQVGDDWLRYQHHLKAPEEGSELTGGSAREEGGESSTSIFLGSASLEVGCESEGGLGEDTLTSPTDTVMEPREEADTSTSYLPTSASPSTSHDHLPSDNQQAQEEETIRDVCQPFIVSRALEEGESEGPWLFLRVTEEELLEVELMTADVLERLELSSLTAVRASHQLCQSGDGQLPAVDCHFSYIRKDKRRRKYVIMDKSPEEAAQQLLELLSAALARNLRVEQVEPPQQQCLKCRHEFQPLAEPQPSTQPGSGDHISFLAAVPQGGAACPRCGSDHVVVLPARSPVGERRTSTPLPPDQQPPFLDSDTPRSSKSDVDPGASVAGVAAATLEEGGSHSLTPDPDNSSSFVTAKSGSFYLEGEPSGGEGSDREMDMSSAEGETPERSPSVSHSCPGLSHKGSLNSTSGSLTWSYRYSNSLTPTPGSPLSEYGENPTGHARGGEFNLNVEDFQTIDHRLKLFFDVEVFNEDKEDYQCFIKAGAVKAGCPGEFSSLLVVSNINIYILEVTGPIRGQPNAWLRRRESHALLELVCVQVGLRTQSIGLQFEGVGGVAAAYTLLIRNPAKCRSFIQFFTDVVRELTPGTVSKLRSISFTRMDPRHQLWPLVCERSTTEALEGKRPNYLYVLAFLQQDGQSVPVSVVATPTTLHLLEENHEWRPSETGEGGSPGSPQLPLIDTQPICNISSICLYQSSPQHLLLRVYHEVTRTESVWGLHTECVELVRELVEWLRAPWEEMFGVPLRVTVQSDLDWPEA